MFGDGLFLVGPELSPWQIETAAADIADYYLPMPCSIVAVGAVVTETFAAQATDFVLSIDYSWKGLARTEILALTINSDLKRGDGSQAAQTALSADTDIVAGDVAMYKTTALPKALPAGTTLFVEAKTAASGAGGAIVPVVLLRVEGYDMQSAHILS